MNRIRHLFASTLAVAALLAIASPPPAQAQTIIRLDGSDFFEASFWTQANANSLITGLNTHGTEILSSGRGGTGNAFTKFAGPDNAERTFTLPNASATLVHTGNTLADLAATTSAQLAGVLSDETGSGGGFVRATSPTLVTPVLGAATATSINGLTINNSTGTLAIANGKTATLNNSLTLSGTDGSTVNFGAGGTVLYSGSLALTDLAAGTSAQLAALLSDETGSGGGFVRATSPTLVTPVLGAATATSINGLTINSSTGTVAIANGKTATLNNTLTLQGTDGSTVSFGAGGTVAYTGNTLGDFAATTSAQLANVLSDETGTAGGFVRATSATLTTPRFVNNGYIADSNGNELLQFGMVSGAVTYAKLSNNSGSSDVTLAASGATNVSLALAGAGTGVVKSTSPFQVANLYNDAGTKSLALFSTPSAVNFATLYAGTTGNGVVITASGSDTDVGLSLAPKGAGTLGLSAQVMSIASNTIAIDGSVLDGFGQPGAHGQVLGCNTGLGSPKLQWVTPAKSIGFTSQAQTNSTGEETLSEVTVPAATLAADGNAVKFTGAGYVQNGATTKRLRLYIAGSQVFDSNAGTLFPISQTRTYSYDGELVRVGSNSQVLKVTFRTNDSSTEKVWTVTTATLANDSADIAVTLTGETPGSTEITNFYGKARFEP